jgi:hypothetical protein
VCASQPLRQSIPGEPAPIDHAAAVGRLQEIAAEWGGQRVYLALCGWPALERRAVVELAHLQDEGKAQKPFDPRRVTTTVVTVAVAANQRIVRFEGTLAPDGPVSAADQVVILAGGLQCAAQSPAGQTTREVLALNATLSGPLTGPQQLPAAAVSAPEPADTELSSAADDASLQAPGLVQGGVGELQIAVSSDGTKVLVAANSGNSLSTDGGLTYTPNPAIPWGFRVDGDPSVGVGVSGNFYFSTIGIPKASSPAPCTDSVAVSLDGQSFTFVGNAVSCKFAAGNNCFPDQEQMAVDRKNATSGGKDQLYMVWRNFPPQGNATCINITTGNPTPTLSCSKNSGQTWGSQTAVGSGDVGRVAVGGDGFVYVTYVSGSNLMINKFSSCDSGLNQQAGFPVTIASLNGVNCPVPGLDRCNNATDASPQSAVSDTKVKQVFVAYADNVNGNESIVVRQSLNGGQTWPNKVNVNGGTAARRFLPWICVSKGTPYVTWYDRSSATAAAPDRTAYFVNFLTPTGNSMTAGKPRNVSQVSDPQCATGWPCSLDNQNDATGCPATTSQLAGACLNGNGGGSGAPCNFNGGVCPSGESCQPGGGCPKYGDYNGNACLNGGVYVAWASATPPPGVVGAPAGLNVFTDHLNFGRCGKANLPCCLAGAVCGGDATLACNASGNCVPCGDVTAPCCATGAQCKGTAICNAQNVCSCGSLGEPCCGASATCQPGLACDINSQCACGGVNQPCCFPSGTCNATLSCTNGHCFPGASQCASCKTNLQLCLAKCGSDAHCQCLCHNSDCSCLLAGSCGICTFQNCG